MAGRRTRRRDELMDLTVRDRAADATRPPVVATPEATLRTIARLLWEQGVGAATVVDDEERVIGIISERDIVARLAQGSDADTTTAEQAMTKSVVSARPDDRLLDVVFLMTDAGVRHVPVIDEHGETTGMVSIRDMVRPLLVAHLGG
jgi:CBS domain-containing protein